MTKKKAKEDFLDVGRPTKYRPEYCEELIKHFESGYSYESFAGALGVNLDTLYHWQSLFPEFSEAKKIGIQKSRLVWEKMGIHGTMGKIPGFSPAMWIFNMKNRFRWTDRMETDVIEHQLEAVPNDKLIIMAERAIEILREAERSKPLLIDVTIDESQKKER